MKNDNIPPLYTLAVYYKRKTKQVLNTPYNIKDRIQRSKKRIEGVCRRFTVWKPFKKLAEVSAVHLIISLVLFFIGVFFGYWFWTYLLTLVDLMNCTPTGLFTFLFFLVIAILWSFSGLVLMFDGFCKWLIKVNNTNITYELLEERKRRKSKNR